MKIMIVASSFSGLCQRVVRELALDGHELFEHYDLDPPRLREELEFFKPELVLCPFLTQRIPEDVWRNHICLVVHPGIEGDRGPSSLDWAISEGESTWGVTLLQADEEMDAGDIWGTKEFALREAAKTSVYKREVSSAAIVLIKDAIKNANRRWYKPRPLNYKSFRVKGRERPLCKQDDRHINWQQDATKTIVAKLNAADTTPGVRDILMDKEVHLFGAQPDLQRRGTPGDIIAVHKGAICRATVDGAVWIRQMKHKYCEDLAPIKLPASMVLNHLFPQQEFPMANSAQGPIPTEEIRVEQVGDVAYVYFNFYNGAAGTRQCQELRNTIRAVKNSKAKVIVFMGGEDFYCNGIHLNLIEASQDPATESWNNINAIDDVVLEMIDCPNQITVAALRNNAGAGGAIMALACDEVIIREGVVLNPHYINMGLYGSEYWTYLLPRKIGPILAEIVVNGGKPMLAKEALKLGFADAELPEAWDKFHKQLDQRVQQLSKKKSMESILANKFVERAADEARKPLSDYRKAELGEMRKIFFNPVAEYHAARRAFVYKEKRQVSAQMPAVVLSAAG